MKNTGSLLMRTITVVILLLMVRATYADGLLTNTKQSAQYTRMLSRNASTQIDAVYFNPAGLMKLDNGIHFALSDQVIFQETNIESNYPVLDEGDFAGKMTAPFCPSAFIVYKMEKIAFSLGAFLVSGGGTLKYADGLPSFEIPISRQVPELTLLSMLPFPAPGYNVSGYDADMYYEFQSSYIGIQTGVTYKFNDVLSVYAGVRCTPATNRYLGYIQEGELMVNNEMVPASEWLSGSVLPAATTHRNRTISDAGILQQLVTGGAGALTLSQVQSAGFISSATRAQLESDLIKYAGLSSAQVAALNVNQALSRFNTATTQFTSAISKINTATTAMGDKHLESSQSGLGWTPVLGVNVNVNEQLNAGIRYEFKTKLSMTNKTTADDFQLYPDGIEVSRDIPALLAVGIGYRPMDLLEAQLSYNVFFDSNVEWGPNIRDLVIPGFNDDRDREIDKNTWELALGLQVNLNKDLSFSLGGMLTRPGVAESYQSDFSYASQSITAGAGVQWKITGALILDAGIMNTFYKDVTLTYSDVKLQEWNDRYPSLYSGMEFMSGEYSETMARTRFAFSVGLTYSILR